MLTGLIKSHELLKSETIKMKSNEPVVQSSRVIVGRKSDDSDEQSEITSEEQHEPQISPVGENSIIKALRATILILEGRVR